MAFVNVNDLYNISTFFQNTASKENPSGHKKSLHENHCRILQESLPRDYMSRRAVTVDLSSQVSRYTEVVEELLKHSADVNAQAENGYSALLYLATQCNAFVSQGGRHPNRPNLPVFSTETIHLGGISTVDSIHGSPMGLPEHLAIVQIAGAAGAGFGRRWGMAGCGTGVATLCS